MPCLRTQHGLNRVGLEPPTSGSGVLGINHQATALPYTKIGHIQMSCFEQQVIKDINFVNLERMETIGKMCVTRNQRLLSVTLSTP